MRSPGSESSLSGPPLSFSVPKVTVPSRSPINSPRCASKDPGYLLKGGRSISQTLRKLASVGPTAIVAQGPEYSVEDATPQAAAAIIDAIFRRRSGILPFPDEGDDYPDAGGRRGGVGGMSAMPTSRRFPSISPPFRDPKRSTTPAPYGNATGNLDFPLDEPILMPRIAKALAKHTAGSP